MNRIILLAVSFVYSFMTIAQCDQKEPSDTLLYKKLNQSFSSLATGKGDAISLVNYGSFEPVNGEFKFNFFAPVGPVQKKKVPFFSFSMGGTLIGENTGVLFSNSKFSSGMSAGVKFHLPLCVETHYLENTATDILEKICLEYKKYMKDSLAAIFDYDSSYISFRSIQVRSKKDSLMMRLVAIENQKGTLTDSLNNIIAITDTMRRLAVSTQLLALYRESKQVQLDNIDLETQWKRDSIILDSMDIGYTAAAKIAYLARLEYQKKKDTLENSFSTSGSKASWITFILDVQRRRYYQFHKTYSFDEQVEELKNTKRSFGIEFNFAGYAGKGKSVFAGPLPKFHSGNLGIIRLQTNDIDDYSTVEYSNAVKYTNGDSTHSLSSKSQVYVDSIIKYAAWKFYGNFYRTFGKEQKFAWHLFADVELRSNNRNPVSAGAGILFALKNKKDNSILNFEIYGKLSDIGKALPTKERFFYNRNEIGIHVGIPINIPTFK